MKPLALLLALASLPIAPAQAADGPKMPRIVGPWRQVAGDPDLGELTSPQQQVVDFGIWQAADGTWQIWSCIRDTKEVGLHRLLHRWEGKSLDQPDWQPMGVAMRGDESAGERPGGLQAPFVLREGDRFVMFYGGWDDICSAASADGKTFERNKNAQGKATLFSAPGSNPRDAMVLRIGKLWHCYYTAHPEEKGAVYCRTSPDLKEWSEPQLVARGGQSGDGPYSSECPFVVEPTPGEFYLFRNQIYGEGARCSVYHSRDPLDFGVDNDEGHFVGTLPIAAPEVFQHDGQWYVAALLPSLKGIQIAKLEWE